MSPRILLGAYACHPSLGSESFVGWNRTVQAARFGTVDVLLHADPSEVPDIEAAVDREGIRATTRLHYLAHSPLERALQRVPGGYYPSYRLWQRRALEVARELHAERPFDLVHQATFCGFREPGDLWRLDLPFVWGPLGGTQNTPAAFLDMGGAGLAVGERARTWANGIQLRGARVREAADAATVLLAANSTGKRDLEAVLGRPVRQLLETGTESVGVAKRWADRAPGPFRLLWAGLLNPTKGIRLALGALEALRATGGPDVEFTVVGDGPERDLVQGVPGLDWRGWVPRSELLGLYAEADAFAFTSLRDTSGNVMLEALAAGLPVVYLDHQGAADMGSEACGVPIPVTTPDRVVADLVEAVAGLATAPERYDRLSRGAIARAHELSWASNGVAMAEIYREALGMEPARESAPEVQALKPELV